MDWSPDVEAIYTCELWDNMNGAKKPNREKQPLWDDGQMFGSLDFLEEKI